MHFPSLLAIVATASVAAIEARQFPACQYSSFLELASSRRALINALLGPETPSQFRPNGPNANLEKDFYPTLGVSVKYGDKAVNFGNTFTTVETVSEPSIDITAERFLNPFTTKYSVIMADPDAPNPVTPILGNFLHEILSDVQPACVTNQQRKTVAPYMSPTPLCVAPHRYTFFVYRQPPNYTPPPNLQYTPGLRANFNVTKYAEDAGLVGPIGGNFFREGAANLIST